MRSAGTIVLVFAAALLLVCCGSHRNTARSRFIKSFHSRYNTYYNGSLAFIDGTEEQENGNADNFTEMLPMYMPANKATQQMGSANFARAIEKSEKVIKLYSIKRKPEWKKSRRKNAKDIEWLSRREYNPFLWHAWLLMGKSQFCQGKFDESAATFSYMSRLYATQPAISGVARAWLAKSYLELGWLYDAEDVITKQQRDTIHYRARRDWDYALADYHVRAKHWDDAARYLRLSIRHERRKKQRARLCYLLGQVEAERGDKQAAYKAFRRVVRMHPPYVLEFNARVAQTEVMAKGQSKKMIRRLKAMARNDNNQEYIEQVYYAIGNIHMADLDTLNAIAAYEKGAKKATRAGIEKGVLLLRLGDIYWTMERYADAQRCYGEAIGLLDKERDDYKQLSDRSKVLDELVPFTEAVHLQDSLLALSTATEADRNAAIDRVIEALKQKEKEEKRAQQEAFAEQQQAKAGQQGRPGTKPAPTAPGMNKDGSWYFYNAMAVNQGKTAFQQQWGKRENTDDWNRANRTVVALPAAGDNAAADSATADGASQEVLDSIKAATAATAATDSAAADPHKREYYMAQIPFTDEQKASAHDVVKDGLLKSGIIFKDKLDNMPLAQKQLTRLTADYPDWEHNDDAWYHLYLLYSRLGKTDLAADALAKLQSQFPESKWTTLLSNPYYEENARIGVHLEDSLYAQAYDAFKSGDYAPVRRAIDVSTERFPLGFHRPKLLFIDGLALLNQGEAQACLDRMTEVVQKHPQSEVAEMAGMIVKGVQAGRALHGGTFDLGDIWSRRASALAADSTATDTLSTGRDEPYVLVLAFRPDSVGANQLLYEVARYNFSNFIARGFGLALDNDGGIGRLTVSGFTGYDEAAEYARKLAGQVRLAQGVRSIVISQANLRLLGSTYSYKDYELFYEQRLAPIPVAEESLPDIPDDLKFDTPDDIYDKLNAKPEDEGGEDADDDLFPDAPASGNGGAADFPDDFYN